VEWFEDFRRRIIAKNRMQDARKSAESREKRQETRGKPEAYVSLNYFLDY